MLTVCQQQCVNSVSTGCHHGVKILKIVNIVAIVNIILHLAHLLCQFLIFLIRHLNSTF